MFAAVVCRPYSRKADVQTVYDVFAGAPIGAGAEDMTAGSALVTGYFTARN